MDNSQTFDKSTLHRTKFILLLIFQIPSILLTISIFLYFIKHPAHVRNIRHQALLLLLIVNFIQLTCDIPMPMHFYRFGFVQPSTSIFCTWWTFFEYSLDIIIALLTAMISIHRHVLIFHDQLLQNRLQRYLIYYLPLLFCVIYPLIVYTILIFIYPCDGTQWDYTSNVCGFANCYLIYNRTLALYDWIGHNGLPTVIIIVANVLLIIRVIKKKHQHQQPMNWRKQRRMTVQLLSISLLFLIAWLPSLIIGIGQQFINSSFAIDFQLNYALDCIYLMCLFLPWICIKQITGFTHWIFFRFIHSPNDRQANTIRPM